ncbi:MAG: hypothetical protein Q4C70_01875 [Planctomycetia bacterium]|nr:hypothetical protein [Planctomycetia bacterium]
MLNEVQKNNRTGKWVRFSLLLIVLVGLFLMVVGIRTITKDLPLPEDDFSTPKLPPAPTVTVIRDAQLEPVTPPEKVYFQIDGKEVSGTVIPQESSTASERESFTSRNGNKPSQNRYHDSASGVSFR